MNQRSTPLWTILLLINAQVSFTPPAFSQSNAANVRSRAHTFTFPGTGNHSDWLKALSLYHKGMGLKRSGSDQAAIDALKQAIETYALDYNFHNGLAITYYERNQPGDLPLAETSLREAIKLNPNSCELWDNLGKIVCEQRRFGDAKECLVKALHCNPSAAKMEELKSNISTLDQKLRENSIQK